MNTAADDDNNNNNMQLCSDVRT